MAAAGDVRAAVGRIKAWARANDPSGAILRSLGPPATAAALGDFESRTKLTFPAGLRALYRLHDGQDPGRPPKGEVMPPAVGLFPSVEAGDRAFQLVPLKHLRTNTPTTKRASRMPGYRLNWVGFGDNGFGDNLVVDLADTTPPRKRGRVLQFNHEYGGAFEVASSVEALLTKLARDLEARRVKLDEDSGLAYRKGRDWDDLIDAGKVEYDPEFVAEYGDGVE